MVRQWQDLFYEKRYSATVLDDGVDFVKLAEAMGAKGYRVTSQEEFKEAFKEALESEVPVLIDCIINCDDKVWPMVAPGEAISSSFTGEDLAKTTIINQRRKFKMSRVYNFSAGPAVLPEEVLKRGSR